MKVTECDFAGAARQFQTVLDKRLFFVCGALKSGTTWLERLLDAHPRIVCKGEAHFGSDILRPMETLVANYNDEVARKGGVIAHLSEYGGATDVLSYDEHDVSFLVAAAIAMMFSKWIQDDEVECIGDKTPGNLEYMTDLSTLFPAAKFIHIIRDGRDVAVSLWRFNQMTDIGRTILNWGTFEHFAADFAATWSDQVASAHTTGRALGEDRYIEVKYEELLAEGHAQLTRVLRFLGVDSSDEIVSRCIDACSFERMSGGRKRGDEDPDSFYRKGISGDWKNHFKAELTEEFHRNSRNLLKELGYSD